MSFRDERVFEDFMQANRHRHGWKRNWEAREGTVEYHKRVDGVWFTLWWLRGYYAPSTEVDVRATKSPVSILDEDLYNEAREATKATLDLREHTAESIEAKVKELARAWKSYASPELRKRKQELKERREHSRWRSYHGAEAISEWRSTIEEHVTSWADNRGEWLRNMKRAGIRPERKDIYMTTREMWRFIVEENTGSYELGWPTGYTRDQAARAFRAILEGLAKAGKLSKIASGVGDVDWGPP